MKSKKLFFKSFYVKVALSFMLSLLFVALLGNFVLFRYSLKSQFNQLRDKLKVITQTAALSVDSVELNNIPLNHEGINTPAFKNIVIQLLRIKQINPVIRYIYIMKKTDQPGIWQFVVDPDALTDKITRLGATSYPGDKYDASRFPDMLEAFSGASVDADLKIDEWGKLLSGYAPIFDKDNLPVAVLGIDIDAADVYFAEKDLFYRGIFVLLMGVIIALGLSFIFSARIIGPIKKLIDGTKHITEGDLGYRVKISSQDELGQLAASFNDMAASLALAREKLHDYFYRVVQAMVRSLEAKDHYTRGHSDRVGEYAYKIAMEMGIPLEKAEMLKETAQLHDIGKLGIHEDILNKKVGLSESEWDIVHKHPEVGEEILKPVLSDAQMLAVVRSHHERYDGQGYPDGLKGDQINIFAQIVTVADAYDAMTTSRSYKTALTQEEALARIKESAGTQFSPAVVLAFVSALKKHGNKSNP
ncbi:MAG: HD-GYP domain-containing protein [Candidatus Omnitrophica bacterium]|nr:HD-GYP domain-containing protein [Candidatus Omnitrophota bacterium]